MSREYKVIVDSMADFEIGYENPDVVIVPTPVMIGGEDFTDATPNEFYHRQREVFVENRELRRAGKRTIAIKTSAPNPLFIEEAMLRILAEGKDAIYVATASSLTSAYQSGRIAVNAVNEETDYLNKAICIDGLSMSALTAVMVRLALQTCNTTEEFVRFIVNRRNDTEHFFAVKEWDAFRDSGRISETTLKIAKLVGFKPLMRFDYNEAGERKAFCEQKSRHFRNLCRYAAAKLKETADEQFCMIIHADNLEGASMLKDEISRIAPNITMLYDLKKCRMGPATGVHLGYSAIGLAFMRKPGIYAAAEAHRKNQRLDEAIYGYELP